MRTSSFENGKLKLCRSPEERKPLIERLNRIEGQVRGVTAMIEADRYCGDELHQIKAAIAALQKVAVIIAGQHVAAAAERLDERENRADANKDIARILRDVIGMVTAAPKEIGMTDTTDGTII